MQFPRPHDGWLAWYAVFPFTNKQRADYLENRLKRREQTISDTLNSDVGTAQKVRNMMRICMKWSDMDLIFRDWQDKLPPDLDEDGDPVGVDVPKFHNDVATWVEGFIMEYYGANEPLYIPGEVLFAHKWRRLPLKERSSSPPSKRSRHHCADSDSDKPLV